jgi:hypothetical protein
MSQGTPGRLGQARRRTPIAWDIEPDQDEKERSSSTRFVDFVAFFAFGFPVVVTPITGLPVNEVFPLVLCAFALGREATSRRRVPSWFMAGLGLVLTVLVITSYLHGLAPAKRLLHVTLYIALATFLASGRIHIPSAVRGLGFGIGTSIVLSMAGFGPDNYVGRLTGYLGDPNGGGYIITVLGAVALGLGSRRRLRYVLMVLIPVAVVLTYSRTTLLAVTFSVVWLLVGRRLSTWAGALLVGTLIYVVGHIPPELRLFGPFSDRGGSDALRARIIAQEHTDIALSPFIGSGAGTAHVNVDGNQFFYHNSYLALQREGGILCLVLLLGVVAVTLISLTRMPKQLRNVWLEAGMICLIVCAVNLGEVLLELPAAVILGMSMYHILNGQGPPGEEPDPSLSNGTRSPPPAERQPDPT